jgi:hypothetical protein
MTHRVTLAVHWAGRSLKRGAEEHAERLVAQAHAEEG